MNNLGQRDLSGLSYEEPELIHNGAELLRVEEAAKMLGQTVELLKRSLIQRLVPFGYAVVGETYDYRKQEEKKTYRYIIFRKRLIAYMEAMDLGYREPKRSDVPNNTQFRKKP